MRFFFIIVIMLLFANYYESVDWKWIREIIKRSAITNEILPKSIALLLLPTTILGNVVCIDKYIIQLKLVSYLRFKYDYKLYVKMLLAIFHATKNYRRKFLLWRCMTWRKNEPTKIEGRKEVNWGTLYLNMRPV